MSKTLKHSAVLLSALLCVFAGARAPGAPDSIVWGPKAGDSALSAVSGVEDAFALDLGEALARAARTAPNGASQSSNAENGRTAQEMTIKVVRDAHGHLVYEVSDGGPVTVHAPGPREGFDLALFAAVPAFIEPDPSSYPHELLGLWAFNGEAGVFYGESPPIAQGGFDGGPKGRAIYQGDAVVLHVADGATTKLLADVTLTADFSAGTVSGRVDGFRSFDGKPLGGLSVTLAEVEFPRDGKPFSGETAAGAAGGGRWGARGSGSGVLGGTFGFAANGGVTVLGAFMAVRRMPDRGGNPDAPDATRR